MKVKIYHIFVAASTVEKSDNVRKRFANLSMKIRENKSRKLDQKFKKRIDKQTLFRIVRMFDVWYNYLSSILIFSIIALNRLIDDYIFHENILVKSFYLNFCICNTNFSTVEAVNGAFPYFF